MDSNSYKTWAILGGAGGAGFGLVITPLIYLLVNFFFGGASFASTAGFAIANAFTWGVLGLIAGAFLWYLNAMRQPPASE